MLLEDPVCTHIKMNSFLMNGTENPAGKQQEAEPGGSRFWKNLQLTLKTLESIIEPTVAMVTRSEAHSP